MFSLIFGENGLETLGFNSPSLNPENELPQWQQKIANAENTSLSKCRRPDGFSARSAIFCRYWTCSFSGRNNQAIGPRLSAIFTFFHRINLYVLLSVFISICRNMRCKDTIFLEK